MVYSHRITMASFDGQECRLLSAIESDCLCAMGHGLLLRAGSILLAWYYCWRQILFGNKYTLWVPHPSIATHMVAGMEAPGVDWQKEFDQRLSKV